jgi:hypothetical protein
MKVFHSIEVEHILPRNNGRAILDWDNFLLSCKYCNTVKLDHNTTTADYLWPDRDNTDLAFDYDEARVVYPKPTLLPEVAAKASATISLTGLDRNPAGPHEPTEADTRWRSRKEAWDVAKFNLSRWKIAPIKPMAEVIARCALTSGHYSIWMKVFEAEPLVLDEIDCIYRKKGLFKEFLPGTATRVVRANGQI